MRTVEEIIQIYTTTEEVNIQRMFNEITENERREVINSCLSYLAENKDTKHFNDNDRLAISVVSYELVTRMILDESI
jgi:hypothetical protein